MRTSIRLDDESAARLQALAERTGQPESFHIRRAITAYLADVSAVASAMNTTDNREAAGRRSRAAGELWAELE